jgi:hypothetical protein
MRRAFIALLVLVLTGTTLDLRGSCTARVDTARFTVQPDCTYEKPCIAGQPVAFRIAAETGCISPWVPCQDYTFDACDTITWDFGDGTQISGHTPTASHAFTHSGKYDVYGHIDNGRGQNVGGSTVVIAQNPPAFVEFAAGDYVTHEDAHEVTITLKRRGNVSGPVHMKLDTGAILRWKDAPDTRENEITMPAGATEMPLTLLVPNDDTFNGERREFVYVYCDTGEAVLPSYQTLANTYVRIVDDETGPRVSVSDATVLEGDTSVHVVSIPMTLSQPLAQDVPIFVTYVAGTAAVGRDFDTPDGEHNHLYTVTIPAGSTHANLTALVYGDTETEGDETFSLVLEVPTIGPPVSLDHGQVVVTIADDDLYRFTPSVKQTTAGVSDTLTIVSGRPSATPVELTLHSTDPTIVSVPSHVTLTGASATFPVEPLRAGDANVIATTPEGNSFDLLVVVTLPVEPPPPPPPPPVTSGSARHRGVRH